MSLLDQEKYILRNKGQLLEIMNAGLLDSTKFKCTASNIAGVSDITYSIEVQIPPIIKKQHIEQKDFKYIRRT